MALCYSSLNRLRHPSTRVPSGTPHFMPLWALITSVILFIWVVLGLLSVPSKILHSLREGTLSILLIIVYQVLAPGLAASRSLVCSFRMSRWTEEL